MAKTINSNTGAVTLNSGNPGDNPLTILAGVTVTAAYTNGVTADASQTWTITNNGTVLGGSYSAGVRFNGHGRLVNNGTASSISGDLYGVKASDSSVVVNRGGITGALAFGVYLGAGGTITNLGPNASISGAQNGIIAVGAAKVTNHGTVAATNSYGIRLQAGGIVTNLGAQSRVTRGIGISGSLGTVSNQGTITAPFDAVNLSAGGVVLNTAKTAAIIGVSHGVAISGGAGTVDNKGTISASSSDGILVSGGGTVTNSGVGAHIVGHRYGIFGGNVALGIFNQGTIAGGTGSGIYLATGSTVTNATQAALISGGANGIRFGGATPGATIVNHGTIMGAAVAVQFGSGGGNLLEVFPRAVFGGTVQAGSGANDMLELGSSASEGTISSFGSQYVGFEQLTIDSGAHWTMAGANTIAATVGLRISPGARLRVAGSLVAPSNLTITGIGTLAAVGGGIEIGTAGIGLPNQIWVDPGNTLSTRGVLQSGALHLEAGAVLIGAGTVASRAVNLGLIESHGGTLAVAGSIIGAGTLKADSGSVLEIDGAGSKAGVVVNRGGVAIGDGASLQVTGSVDPGGSGLFILNDTSLLRVAADTGTGHQVQFLGAAGATLSVDSAGLFGSFVGAPGYAGPLLKDFGGAGDAIELRDLVFAGATIDSYTLHGAAPVIGVLQLHSGATLASLAFDNATLTGASFQIANAGGHVLLTHT